MSGINQKEYLKKYLSGSGGKEKKKKSKKKAKSISRVKIIDDDLDHDIFNEEAQADLLAANEDAPQVVGVIDDRPLELRMDDFKKENVWKSFSVGNENKRDSPVRNGGNSSSECGSPPRRRNKGPEDNSPPRRGFSDDASPPRRNNRNSPPRKTRGEDDYSPKRKKRFEDDGNKQTYDESPPRRSKRDGDESPPRKQKRDDNSPPRRRNVDDNSPPRRQRGDDNSPPRRRKEGDDNSPPGRRNKGNDNSPPRRKKPDDSSPPRRRISNDNSPPRRRKDDNSPPRRNRGDDNSPPRRRKEGDDNSPPRRKRTDDNSPPRRRTGDDKSPPRRKRTDDNSPPRRRKGEDNSPPRRQNRNDNSPPRNSRIDKQINSPRRKSPVENRDKEKKKSRWGDEPTEKMTKTLDGKSAGLQNAKDLVQETRALKQREEELFKNMSAEVSGVNAGTIVRNRKTGQKRNFEQEAEEKREKEKASAVVKEKYDRWGKGVKQVEEYKEKLEQDAYEMSKPLARYADDKDLETYLKEQEREGDPMLAYIRKKKKKVAVETGVPMKPMYEGEFMPNRFGIRPGHKWDGVDRSSGYETKWFEIQNSKRAALEESYKWSTEDM